MRIVLIFTLFISSIGYSQITGIVIDGSSNEPIIGAKVICSDGNRAITGFDGDFTLNSKTYPVKIITSMLQYVNDTTIVEQSGKLTITLKEPLTDLETVVISA